MLLIVTGMHHSGASAVAGVLDAMGLVAFPHHVSAALDPRRGDVESRAVVAANDECLAQAGGAWWAPPPRSALAPDMADAAINSVAASLGRHRGIATDPRFCLTLPAWDRALGHSPPVVLVVRHPVEVAESLTVNAGLRPALGVALWAEYHQRILTSLSDRPTLLVDYARCLAEPQGCANRIADFARSLGADVDPVRVAAAGTVLDPTLVRQDPAMPRPTPVTWGEWAERRYATLRERHGLEFRDSGAWNDESEPGWAIELLDGARDLVASRRDRDVALAQLATERARSLVHQVGEVELAEAVVRLMRGLGPSEHRIGHEAVAAERDVAGWEALCLEQTLRALLRSSSLDTSRAANRPPVRETDRVARETYERRLVTLAGVAAQQAGEALVARHEAACLADELNRLAHLSPPTTTKPGGPGGR